MKSQTTKKLFLLGILIPYLLTGNIYCQLSPAQLRQLEMIKQKGDQMQSRYDEGYDLALQVNEKINKLKSEYDDKELIDGLNKLQKELHSIEDFGANLNNIKRINSNVNNEIFKYDDRVRLREEQENSVKKENVNSSSYSQNAVTDNNLSEDSPETLARKYWEDTNRAIQLNDFTSAIQSCNKVIDLYPTLPEPYSVRAYLNATLEQYSNAVLDYTNFLEHINKDSINLISGAYFNRGLCKGKLNDHYGAISDYQKVVELMPEASMAYNNIAWEKFLLKKFSDALIDANRAIELDNTNYLAWDTRAEIKLNLKDFNGCIKDCDFVIKLNPDYSNCYFLKGSALFQLKSVEEACKLWSKSGELGKAEAYELISKYCQN